MSYCLDSHNVTASPYLCCIFASTINCSDIRKCRGVYELVFAETLTHYLYVNAGRVLHVLNLQAERVSPRVIPLSGADEEDGVNKGIADADFLHIYGLTIFSPYCHWPRLPLECRAQRQ